MGVKDLVNEQQKESERDYKYYYEELMKAVKKRKY